MNIIDMFHDVKDVNDVTFAPKLTVFKRKPENHYHLYFT